LLQKKKKKKVPGRGLGSQIKCNGIGPRLDFSPQELHVLLFLSVLLKLIGKVNEINMAKHCVLLRRKEPDMHCPLLNHRPFHASWGHFVEASFSEM
jgi:hypothetical protein